MGWSSATGIAVRIRSKKAEPRIRSLNEAAKNMPRRKSGANRAREVNNTSEAPMSWRMSQAKFEVDETIARRLAVPSGFDRSITTSRRIVIKPTVHTATMAKAVSSGLAE